MQTNQRTLSLEKPTVDRFLGGRFPRCLSQNLSRICLVFLSLLISGTALAHGVDDNTRSFLQMNTGVQFVPFLYIGAKHMITGYDHILFLVGVIFFLFRSKDVLLYAFLGWEHTLTQMAFFFTKAALLTFGGAYAVLPYVYQGAVSTYGWATPTQMIDGLALGETTPGPLIMVVTFVGFIGGYNQAFFGQDLLLLSGSVAAILVTWFTFLPSFIFILAGGPLIEGTKNNLNLSAPLTAITAAVVGVILNLALFFCYHALWPNGFEGAVDIKAIAITLASALAVFYFKVGIIKVILGAAVTGLLINLPSLFA